MLQSLLGIKTTREAPKDEVSKNAILLSRAGYIHKELAGAYVLLPLGLRVARKIEKIIRDEMDALGGIELHMTALQREDLWKKTDRWDDKKVDTWFKSKLNSGGDIGFGWTHEEVITNLMKHHISSHKDFPRLFYQIQTKFRNEKRAKSGLLRGREFTMKDLYSFTRTQEEHNEIYDEVANAYQRIYDNVGIGGSTYNTFASGGLFAKFSNEFQTVTDAGEDTIYIDENKNIAVNKEVLSDEVCADLGIKREELVEKRAIEVGNIFSLGTRFSDDLDLNYKDENGKEQKVVMGSYGIGVERLMGVVAELYGDENSMIFPTTIAPFDIHLIMLDEGDENVSMEAKELYDSLQYRGVEVLLDDRQVSAGEKLKDSDLLGIPKCAIVSSRTIKKKKVEYHDRINDMKKDISKDEFYAEFV
ncbi:MAG: His/Gly/Thr/Pro-type tRNA ligase C-terminal domain-containing protein [Candidatus Campbellbacteria bacterium]|nr:His/Gly/Thr/Pro-type tRNA ligase C-terminal domain-containing protein [Candidatus Campbellbacteria bacterium]